MPNTVSGDSFNTICSCTTNFSSNNLVFSDISSCANIFEPTRYCKNKDLDFEIKQFYYIQQYFIDDMTHIEQIKISTLNSETNLLFLNCEIFKIELKALIDSGATHCYMAESTLVKLTDNLENKPMIHPIRYKAKLADGSTAMCKGCVKLNTIIDGQLLPITFILVPSLNFDILLGMTFINEFEVKIEGDEGGASVHIPYRRRHCEHDVRTMESISIPAHSERLVKVKLSHVSNSLVDFIPCMGTFQKYGVAIKPLITMAQNEIMMLPVHNPSNRELILPDDVCMCHVEFSDAISIQEFGDNESAINYINSLSTPKQSELNKINIGQVASDFKQKLLDLLTEYSDLFASERTGTTDKVTHVIDTGNHPPINQPPNRSSPLTRKIIEEQVQKMLQARIIQPSKSPWTSRIVLVRKKDGSVCP